MALTEMRIDTLGDLVQHEYEPSTGYCRDVIPVDFASAANVTVGTLVSMKVGTDSAYREFALSDLTDSATIYAVLIGDHYKVQSGEWAIGTAATTELAYVRGPLILKEWKILQALDEVYSITPDAGQIATLKAKLKAQGILVETTVPSSADEE